MLSRRLMKSLWIPLCFWLLACRLAAQQGSPDDFALPAAPDGTVEAVATQSDGKTIVVGSFTSIAGSTRGRLARLNLDGSLDATFATGAGANGTIRAVLAQTDGKLLIGGEFTTYDGVSCGRIARLNTDGSLDGSFAAAVGPGANGPVYALATDSTMSQIVVGGDFTTFADSTRNRIALLRGGGSLLFLSPVSFNGGANGAIHALLLTSSSTIIAAGSFTSIAGSARNRVAILNSLSGTLDGSFNASGGPDGTVRTLWLDNNSLYIGGDFTAVGGVSRPGLAALTASSGALATSFTPTANGTVRTLLGSGSGATLKLIVGGDFTQIGTTAANRVARLDAAQAWALDAGFLGGSGADGNVRSLLATRDGKTLVAGDFSTIGGATRSAVARLYGTAGNSPPVAPGTPVVGGRTDTSLSLYSSGASLALGYKVERSTDQVQWTEIVSETRTLYQTDAGLSPGATYHYRLRAYNSNGAGAYSVSASGTTLPAPWAGAGPRDAAFSAALGTGAAGFVEEVKVQPDGKIVLVGSFSTFAGVTRNRVARLLADGGLDTSFDPGTGPNSSVEALAIQADGKILIGGNFTSVAGVTRNRVARLLPDGGLDSSFAPPSGCNSTVSSIAVAPNGTILISGGFTTVNGVARAGIARLATDGTLDTSFNPGAGLSFANGDVVVVQPDGKVVVAGFFQSAAGVAAGNIARFHSNGSLDTGFGGGGAGADSWIEDLRLLPDGRFVIAGPFDSYNGVARPGLARLLPDGRLDTSFNPGAGLSPGWAESVEVQPDGRVIAGGWFILADGQLSRGIARFLANGALDPSFLPGSGASSDVVGLALQPDGKCVAVGYFTTFGESSARGVCRLLGDAGSAPPTAPASANAVALSSTSVRLTWASSSWVSGYTIERSPEGAEEWSSVGQAGPAATSHDVGGLAPAGAYVFRIRAFSTNGSSTGAATASARTLSLYAQWKLDAGLPADAGADADTDGDGLPNLLEYALGSSPVSAASTGVATIESADGRLSLSYQRLRDELTYLVESSTDLATWTAADVDQGGAGPQVTASTPLDGGRKFLRLRVTLP